MTPPTDLRLLVIDDDPAICQLLSDLARGFGYDTTTASTPDEIFERLGGSYALIMLDLSLGETDGMRVMRALAEEQPGANLVLLTGADASVLQGARRVAELSGFQVVASVSKPASIIELEDILRPAGDYLGAKQVAARVDELDEDAQLALRVAAALDRGTLHLVYQPIMSIRDSQIRGAEALVRLAVDGYESLSPEIWVPIVERMGRSSDLLDHVLRMAAHDRLTVPSLKSLDSISVNVSVLDLADLGLPEKAERVLGRAASPDHWVLEITETAEVDKLADALDVLIRLRLKGFHLAADDFGSGSSTLARLREYPFTSLKADRRFVRTEHHDIEHAENMLRAAVDLGAALGLRVVAEGIETEDELVLARDVGCDLAQGFYIGRPVRAEAFGILVASWTVRVAEDIH